MKKVMVLLALLLLASAVVVAGEYEAKVWNRIHWNVGNTWNAELSFERLDQPVAKDFILYVGGGCGQRCKKVFFQFRTVQRWSKYSYMDVLAVDNKKPYDVLLSIEKVTPKPPCGQKLTITCDGTQLYPGNGSVIIPAGGDVHCDFVLKVKECASCGHYSGVILWKAIAPAP